MIKVRNQGGFPMYFSTYVLRRELPWNGPRELRGKCIGTKERKG
jgi:hypothetical protein